MRRPLVVTLFLAVTASLACMGDNDPTGPLLGAACAPRGPYMGEFDGTASGSVVDSMAGCAYFVLENETGCASQQQSFNLILSNGRLGKFEQTVAVFICGSRPPANTTLTLGTGGFKARMLDNGSGRIFDMTTGSMSVWYSDVATVRGSVTLSGTEVGGTGTITLSGTFRARCFDPYVPLPDDEGKLDPQYRGPCSASFAT